MLPARFRDAVTGAECALEAALVARRGDGAILALRWGETWHLPVVTLNVGEEPEAAVRRAAAFAFHRPPEAQGALRVLSLPPEGESPWTILFAADARADAPPVFRKPFEEAVWVAPDGAPPGPWRAGHARAAESLLKNRLFPAPSDK